MSSLYIINVLIMYTEFCNKSFKLATNRGKNSIFAGR